jgi:urease accessory protein
MSAQPSRSEALAIEANRVRATLVIGARREGDGTRLARLREGGGYRVKFPACDGGLDAVIVNVGGGVAGGDQMTCDVAVGAGARLRVTTQAAEKVYRSAGAPARLAFRAQVDPGGALMLAPQETILFDAARLEREIVVDAGEGARVLVADMTVFGRLAMGETQLTGAVRDRWRLSRSGRLVHAEDLRLDGALASRLDRPAIGGGARAALTAALLADDADALLEPTREALARPGVVAGASVFAGKLVARALSRDPAALRDAYSALVALLGAAPLPRCW